MGGAGWLKIGQEFKFGMERKVGREEGDLGWVRMVKKCFKFGYVDFETVYLNLSSELSLRWFLCLFYSSPGYSWKHFIQNTSLRSNAQALALFHFIDFFLFKCYYVYRCYNPNASSLKLQFKNCQPDFYSAFLNSKVVNAGLKEKYLS